ncbi:hypothetical protein EGI22_11845 [Lacihabitans sp. LS3-19]|uniref:beta-L-arabinofuranosidase domain-containing protein n=1 Tax=Lacihabitans sp. LS3-19 TaxID=2487335 RepID=UPI0020CC3B27|nr:beta-L-arabinofuranosidase domain-containing protein [Lacihabitans sp. LS3-19]MCP9768608.1 hypothetical protein [Lacihabitans sp. LS3-19]
MKIKQFLIICLLLSYDISFAQSLNEKYHALPFGSIKPSGWLKEQMQKDLQGFVGNLDRLVPSLINDPIYGEGRMHKNSKEKDLGNSKSGDIEGSSQYMWWNSETQSNWWDGYMRNAFLLNDKAAIEKSRKHVYEILKTQDNDGYLGIYDKELRYNFNSENGELWAKATLYRGLLGYFEATQDTIVWKALQKAVANVMENYPIYKSHPFYSGDGFSGGVAHGLTFTDVLDRMYQLTNDKKYWEYAAFLYADFSENHTSESDAQLNNILDEKYLLRSHAVHTYEHLRPLITATYATGNPQLEKALKLYLTKIKKATTMTGGATGDEWIWKQIADATATGYEYCSLHELMDSYTSLLQKSGNAAIADDIENIFYNAAQGSRDPNHSAIAYLKTDNSFVMDGTKNGEVEPNRKQTRYKYSPAHQDVAVCCNPNAGKISPYFVKSAWMKQSDNTLVATLLCPNILETTINGIPVKIEEITEYPYKNEFKFKITGEKAIGFKLKIRKPEWVKNIITREKFSIEDGYIVIEREFQKNDEFSINFTTYIAIKEDLNKEKYFKYGAIVYAKPIASISEIGKSYADAFNDLTYKPKSNQRFKFVENHKATYKNGNIIAQLKNLENNKIEPVTLIPFGKTVLRQTSF